MALRVDTPVRWYLGAHGDPVAEFDHIRLVLHPDRSVTWERTEAWEKPALEPDVPPIGIFDAREWALSFVAHVKRHPSIPTDEGAMIGWFANAIMAGHDQAMRRVASSAPEVVEGEVDRG